MLLDDIADYLSSGGVGTVGTDIFKGYMPEKPDTAVAIYETGGQAPIRRMGETSTQSVGQNIVVERPRVQVVCRASYMDYETARTKANTAFALLDGLPRRTINGVAYKWGAAVQSVFPMGRDETARVLLACNYDIVKDLTT